MAFTPERCPCGCRRAVVSRSRNSGAGMRDHTAASAAAASIESASIRRTVPDGRNTAVPATTTLCPNRAASCSTATPSAMPLAAFPSSMTNVNMRSLWRIVSRVPETRVRCGWGVARIRRSTAATESQSTTTRCALFPPLVNSIEENPAARTRSNLRNVESSGWSKKSESERPSTAARSVCSMTPKAESFESIGSNSSCCRKRAGAVSDNAGASITRTVLPVSMPRISKSAAARSHAGILPGAVLLPSTRTRNAPRVASSSTPVSSPRTLAVMRAPRARSPLRRTVCRFVVSPPPPSLPRRSR